MSYSSCKQEGRRQGLLDQELSAVFTWKDYGNDSQGKDSLRKKDKGGEKIPLFLDYIISQTSYQLL